MVGFCVLDRIGNDDELRTRLGFRGQAWQRREIENYIVSNKQILIDWVRHAAERIVGPLFSIDWVSAMEERITEIENARSVFRQESPWSPDIKVTDDFLDGLFETFFEKFEMTNLMGKTNYHTLVQYLSPEQIDPEVTEVLDAILEVAQRAGPLGSM